MSAIVDDDAPGANMYGCLPCPKCKSPYRYPHDDGGETVKVCCDDCGFREGPAVRADGLEWGTGR
jgi:hypothetical protein